MTIEYPTQPDAESGEANAPAALQQRFAAIQRDVQRNGHRAAITIEADNIVWQFLRRDFHLVRHLFQNERVWLMKQKMFDGFTRVAGECENLVYLRWDIFHGEAENGSAIHVEMFLVLDHALFHLPQFQGLRCGWCPISAGGDHDRLVTRTIVLHVHVNGVLRFTTFNNGDRTRVTGEGIGDAVALVNLLATGITVQQDYLGKRRDFQEHEGLDQTEHKTRATLIDVETDHFATQTQFTLDYIAGGRNYVIWRLRDKYQSANFLLLQRSFIQQVLQAVLAQVGRTNVRAQRYGAGPGSSSS